MQTRPEPGNRMWRRLWSHVLWEIVGGTTDIGHLNGPGGVTGWDRERDVTGTVVPGLSLDMTEVVLTHHTVYRTHHNRHGKPHVWSQWLPVVIHPFPSCL